MAPKRDQLSPVLDEIFASYMAAKPLHAGRFDREFRDPSILIRLATKLGLIPDARRVIRVTGSKGKGTTSRLTARYLGQVYPETRIGLLVSPEELAHTDRMQINGTPISEAAFLRSYNALRPALLKTLKALPSEGYLSPSGLFLLIALNWFKDQGVEHFVLETGRGVISDEVGQIASRVGVVTSILFEHPANLGPALNDIARDKLSVAASSDIFLCFEGGAELFSSCLPNGVSPLPLLPHTPDTSVPGWLNANDRLARSAVAAYAELAPEALPDLPGGLSSPSFGWLDHLDCRIAFEALVSAGSADPSLFGNQFKGHKVLALVSLPDDKDRDGIFSLLRAASCAFHEVALSGTRGYLRYEKAKASSYPLSEMAFNDPACLRSLLDKLIKEARPDILYVVGTHTYIRLFKLAMQH